MCVGVCPCGWLIHSYKRLVTELWRLGAMSHDPRPPTIPPPPSPLMVLLHHPNARTHTLQCHLSLCYSSSCSHPFAAHQLHVCFHIQTHFWEHYTFSMLTSPYRSVTYCTIVYACHDVSLSGTACPCIIPSVFILLQMSKMYKLGSWVARQLCRLSLDVCLSLCYSMAFLIWIVYLKL